MKSAIGMMMALFLTACGGSAKTTEVDCEREAEPDCWEEPEEYCSRGPEWVRTRCVEDSAPNGECIAVRVDSPGSDPGHVDAYFCCLSGEL